MRSLSSSSADGGAGFDIRRNGTVVYSDGQNYRAYSNPSDYFAQTVALNYLDSPSSTAALTYSVFFASYNGTVDVQDDNLYASTMLLWEIAA
jgi:hypothetical protein